MRSELEPDQDFATDDDWLTVACPRCSAAIGQPCKRNRPYHGLPHPARAWIADEAAKKQGADRDMLRWSRRQAERKKQARRSD